MLRLKLGKSKAKQPSKITAMAPTGNKEPFYLSKSAPFAVVQAALKVLQEVSGKIPVPGLQEGVKALLLVLDTMQVR